MRKRLSIQHVPFMLNSPSRKKLSARSLFFLKECAWTIAFILLCAISLEYALKARQKEYLKLQNERVSLELQLKEAFRLHADLLKELNSQNDPEWIELVLMRRLGLVPEGQQKFVFSLKKDS
ncbi:hypothetical protein PHSC3_000534 [Chlamydiales bacterium STE3]|nr:hypothetical protein PHSC3_000534 [Chlamydiales bacterium STE3]